MMQFFERWPSPHELLEADVEAVGTLMQPIGLHMRRANNIRRFTGKSEAIPYFLAINRLKYVKNNS